MLRGAKFVHTNIVARDWKRLALFYEKVFGCQPMPPQRNLSGKWLDKATGIHNAHIQGIHLRLPGYEEGGPTLEIFQYNPQRSKKETAINRPGIAHLAFSVEDVAAARAEVIREGGREIGEGVSVDIPGAGSIHFIYVTDPEGNIIELQRWER